MNTRVLIIFLIFCECESITNDELFPFGIQDDKLPSDADDISSPEIPLSVPIVFYETIYPTIFVNDNGVLSFLTEVPSFFNAQFPLSYPIIAPMYSDVDTRGNGNVYYRETKSQELLQRATQEITRHFSRASSFRAQSLFIATWDNVGRFESKSSPTNTVQVVIASNGTESYALFLYPFNGIQWTQGDGKINNLPDARTQAGLMSGDGRLYVMPGSGADQIRNFDKMSNVNRPGIWMFHIGNTGPGNNVSPPDIDGDKSLIRIGPETCVNTQTPCPPTASCNDHENGFCCVCIDGYFGNGRNCLANNMPLRLNGKVNGLINEIRVESADLHAYIVTQEGRQYTAISRIPPNIGYDLQTLSAIGGVIGWQFATSVSGIPNGFMLTGGVFNRTADINFPQSGHHISITEQFLGPDVFNFLRVNVEIRGVLPSVPFGSVIEIDDFEEEYTRVGRGQIRSHSTRSFNYGENSLSIPISIDQSIMYDECPYAPINEEHSTIKLKVARNYIVYDNREQIVRYASTSKVQPLNTDNPCREGKTKCGEHSSCVVDGDTFKCVCDRGYEYHYRDMTSSEATECADINECALGRDNCHTHADCINLPGSFTCSCRAGYFGNGINCQKQIRCEDLNCHPNAECIQLNRRNPECKCREGYVGDGYVCTRGSESGDCRNANICDVNADCIANPKTEKYQCFCKAEYRGDGRTCKKESESCDLADNCGEDAECVYDEVANEHYCLCNPGFFGDGNTCIAEENYQSCNTINNCHPYAQCVHEQQSDKHQCKCNAGFTGDGFQCRRSLEGNCIENPLICSPNAQCLSTGECKCTDGFTGDGLSCKTSDECRTDDDCSMNAKCDYNTVDSTRQCKCKNGYIWDGRSGGYDCIPDENVACNIVNNCHKDAGCAYDSNTLTYKCQCSTGFRGDGKKCDKQILSCNIINNCDVKAECKYSFEAQGYRCQCIDGFVGDGFTCRSLRTCREDLSICDRNAECLYSDISYSFECHCRHGYVGDGFHCTIAPRYDGDYLLFTQGMSLLRMPFQPSKTDPGQLMLTKANQIPVGLDVDCLQGYVYWTDVAHKVIYRAPYNGTTIETIISDHLLSPEGIAIDWAGRNIYWTDSVKDTIEVARLNGTMHKTIINEGLDDPRGIVVHPGMGKMYWSDWSRVAPKIEVANMDGSGRSTFVDTDIGLPNNLAIDFDQNELCWTDAGLSRIECIGLHGHNRRLVYSPAVYPFDLTIAGDFIYWTDWQIKFIQRVSRNGGTPDPLELPLGGNGRLYSIVTVPHQCQRINNPCAIHNGGCKHLCLPNSRGRTCACPDISDGADECNEIH